MAFTNEVHSSGRALKDAERRGNGPVRFCLTQGGGKKKDSDERWPTEFFNVMAWPNTCDVVELVKKGDVVTVTGRLRQSEWTDPKGEKRRSYEIVAATVELAKLPKPITPSLEITDTDIPF